MGLNFSQFGGVIEEPDNPYGNFANLLNAQAITSNDAGRVAADRADPFQPYKGGIARSLSTQLSDPSVFQQSSERAATLADPFAAYKPQVAESLSKLLSNPGDVTTSPFYSFARDQGIEAITRANKGVDSGRYMSDLLKFGTGYAGQQFTSLADTYNKILGSGNGTAAAQMIGGEPAQTAKLYNDILGGSSVGGAQMLMGGFGRAQDQQSASAGVRAAGNARPPTPSSPQPSGLDAMLQKYGINSGSSGVGGSPAVRGGTGISETGISAPGSPGTYGHGLPTGGGGQYGLPGGGVTAGAAGAGMGNSLYGGYGGATEPSYGNFGGMDTSGTQDYTDYDNFDYNTGGYNWEG